MKAIGFPTVLATSKAPYHTLSLGVLPWSITNDTGCHEETGEFDLTLSSCFQFVKNTRQNPIISDQFTCANGFCIDMAKRCDGNIDCKVMSQLQTSLGP